jgi:hypothetical protein
MRIHPLQLGCGDAQICVVGEIKPLNARGSYLNEPLSLYVIIEGSVVVPGIGLGKERETCHRTSVAHFLYNLDTTTTTTQISWHFIQQGVGLLGLGPTDAEVLIDPNRYLPACPEINTLNFSIY